MKSYKMKQGYSKYRKKELFEFTRVSLIEKEYDFLCEKHKDNKRALKRITCRKERKIAIRSNLLEDKGVRHNYYGTFGGYRHEKKIKKHTGEPKVTMVFSDVTCSDNNELLADHLWFVQTDHMKIKGLKNGTIVHFTAMIRKYKKYLFTSY